MRKHWAALAAIAGVLVCISPAPALAHEGNPNYRSIIDRVTPKVANVKFVVLNYDGYFEVIDQHGHEVVIYGYEREPYARVLKDGTVQVNERSPALYLNDSRFPTTQIPPIANALAPPKWKTFDNSGTFVWHDHRMHYQSESIPPQVTDQNKKTKIFDYTVPISVDGKKGNIYGTLYWVGSPNPSKLPFILIGVAVVIAGGVLVFVVRRRRGPEPGEPPTGEGEKAKEAW